MGCASFELKTCTLSRAFCVLFSSFVLHWFLCNLIFHRQSKKLTIVSFCGVKCDFENDSLKQNWILFCSTSGNIYNNAAIAPWFCLRLPFCGPGFQSQAHHLRFFNLYWNCNVKGTKINKKRPGLAHFLKKTFITTQRQLSLIVVKSV